MSNKIPMPAPLMGTLSQPFDVTQAQRKACGQCGGELFDKAYKMGVISRMASGNRTGQDITVEYPCYVCSNCGIEFGK